MNFPKQGFLSIHVAPKRKDGRNKMSIHPEFLKSVPVATEMNPWSVVTVSIVRQAQVLRARLGAGAGCHDEADNEPVQTKSLREDKNQDHTDEKARLLGVSTDTGVTNNANRKAPMMERMIMSGRITPMDEMITAVMRP